MIVEKFLTLGPFRDSQLDHSGVVTKDWVALDANLYYKGQWNMHKEANGFGVLIQKGGQYSNEGEHKASEINSLYEGQVLAGKPHGIGRLIYGQMAEVYEGEF